MYRGELAKCADLLAFQLGKAGVSGSIGGAGRHKTNPLRVGKPISLDGG